MTYRLHRFARLRLITVVPVDTPPTNWTRWGLQSASRDTLSLVIVPDPGTSGLISQAPRSSCRILHSRHHCPVGAASRNQPARLAHRGYRQRSGATTPTGRDRRIRDSPNKRSNGRSPFDHGSGRPGTLRDRCPPTFARSSLASYPILSMSTRQPSSAPRATPSSTSVSAQLVVVRGALGRLLERQVGAREGLPSPSREPLR